MFSNVSEKNDGFTYDYCTFLYILKIFSNQKERLKDESSFVDQNYRLSKNVSNFNKM